MWQDDVGQRDSPLDVLDATELWFGYTWLLPPTVVYEKEMLCT